MIVIRHGHRPVLQSPAGEADGGGGEDTTVIDDNDTLAGGDDTIDGSDRGDEVDPPIDPKLLDKVAEGDGDETLEGADGADGGAKKRNQFVPVGRFNEVNEEKKRLERENEDLRKKASAAAPAATPAPTPPPKPAFDEDKAEREYATLLAEGEFDKAVAKRKEINAHLREQAREEAETNVEARISHRATVQTLTTVAEKAVQDFPYLDTEDGKDTMDLIIAARRGYEAEGMPPADALAKAVAKIAPKFDPRAATPGKDSTATPSGKDTRSQQATARGAADSLKQPPTLNGGAGNRATAGKVDVEDMTDEQFDALSAAEKRRLRGDDS